MANGDKVTIDLAEEAYYKLYTLLDGQTGAADGVWVDISQYYGLKTVEVSGIGTGTVQIRGSIAATKPANTAHASQLGSDITADGMLLIHDAVRFIKCRKSAAGDSTATTVMLRVARHQHNRMLVE